MMRSGGIASGRHRLPLVAVARRIVGESWGLGAGGVGDRPAKRGCGMAGN